MDIVSYVSAALAGYFLGSIPTGFLVAKAKGVDIRSVGSGNIGATNVFRFLGKPAGLFVLLIDALKGWVAVVLISKLILQILHFPEESARRESLEIIAGVCAILGHNYTCWLQFKGGKGIATSAGVLTALVPWALLIILSLWIIFCALTRYVSVGSLVASFALPFACWITGESWTKVTVTAAMAAMAIYKHKGNIQRLLQGTESRIGAGTKKERT